MVFRVLVFRLIFYAVEFFKFKITMLSKNRIFESACDISNLKIQTFGKVALFACDLKLDIAILNKHYFLRKISILHFKSQAKNAIFAEIEEP